MQNLQLLARRTFPALILLTLCLMAAQSAHPWLLKWSGQLAYLPFLAMGCAALVAIKFSRSRMTLYCVLLLLPYAAQLYSGQLWLNPDTVPLPLLLMAAMAWLLWDKDRGFAPFNALLGLGQIGLAILIAYLLYTPLTTLSLNWLAPVQQWLYPTYSAHFSALDVSLYAILLLTALLRIGLSPTNNHCVLFVSLLLLPLMQWHGPQQLLSIQLSLLSIALLFLLSVILDSHNMAFRDELTGIPSRRALMQYVQTLGKKYVVVMADIDHFKSFNDTYGHDVGDQVLRLVASRMTRVTGGGKAFRYGGEEFTLIFPRREPAQIVPHLEALREDIANYQMVIRSPDRPPKKTKQTAKSRSKKSSPGKQNVRVTCSFGVAERSSRAGEFMAVMKQADMALYDAKKAGRNCVKTRT
ncbi:GGDEF domain-containing protein [Bowmanella denitrificans]|uniref:GGDEF domain-containing protein n=1 Tax=Bowmanella denitrificans TaxID=366582 RepID=UPI000C99833C|nr:GGDEF domain-containing protein [Bowmanella denitrificans]